MSERYEYNGYEAEPLPELSEREILEGMSPHSIVDYILFMGMKATEIETKMNMAAEVLEGVHGCVVEDILNTRRPPTPEEAGEIKHE